MEPIEVERIEQKQKSLTKGMYSSLIRIGVSFLVISWVMFGGGDPVSNAIAGVLGYPGAIALVVLCMAISIFSLLSLIIFSIKSILLHRKNNGLLNVKFLYLGLGSLVISIPLVIFFIFLTRNF
jgi:hypothetical protein